MSSLRVKLILACQEAPTWVWPSIYQNRLVFIQFKYYLRACTTSGKKLMILYAENQWKIITCQLLTKVPFESKNNCNVGPNLGFIKKQMITIWIMIQKLQDWWYLTSAILLNASRLQWAYTCMCVFSIPVPYLNEWHWTQFCSNSHPANVGFLTLYHKVFDMYDEIQVQSRGTFKFEEASIFSSWITERLTRSLLL
jgi:hypothetical protein